jgi:hypothetical protein
LPLFAGNKCEERIGREQSEFYIVGYVPPETPEGSCHTLKVKLSHGGMNVRARSGYCNTRSANPLEGKPVEKQLELHATGSQVGSIHGALQAPYFYTAANVARVNLAMEIPSDSLKFNKEKGKYHANVNILGMAYKPDGSVGARFSDTVNLDLEKDEWKEFTKVPYRYQNQFDAAPGTYRLTVVLSGGGFRFGAGCCAASAGVARRIIPGRPGSVTRFFATMIFSISCKRFS